jgi:hypothetical protein
VGGSYGDMTSQMVVAMCHTRIVWMCVGNAHVHDNRLTSFAASAGCPSARWPPFSLKRDRTRRKTSSCSSTFLDAFCPSRVGSSRPSDRIHAMFLGWWSNLCSS